MKSTSFGYSRWVLGGIIFILAFTLSSVFPQATGTLRGRVTDTEGNPLAEVKITLLDSQRGTRLEILTDKNGNFLQREIIPSIYKVTFALEGYRTVQQEIKIDSRRTPHTKIVLEKFDPRAFVQEDFDKGTQLFRESKFKEAIEVFEKIIEKVPEYAQAHFNLGLCYMRVQEGDKALSHFEKAVELKPDFLPVYSVLGGMYLDKREYSKVVDIYSKAVELDPNNPKHYTNLGLGYCQLRKNDEAIETLNKAIQLDDSDSLTYYLLGVAYDAKGDVEKTVENFEKFIELNPDAPQVAMIKEHIKRLKEKMPEQEQ